MNMIALVMSVTRRQQLCNNNDTDNRK